MFLLIISLLLHCDLLSCVNYEKINFNEDLLMKQLNQNSFQVKAFIKEARHKFHEDTSTLTAESKNNGTTRADHARSHTNWWWDNSTFIEQLGQRPQKNFFFPHIRSRPSFPYSITPYTTEANKQHLNWDKIFPDTRLRTGSEISSTLLNYSLPKTTAFLKDHNNSSSIYQYLMSLNSSRSWPFNTSPRPKSTLKGLLSLGFTSGLLTPNKDYIMWLQEITTFTPVERWLQTLASKTGLIRSYTTNSTIQVNGSLSKAQTPAQLRQSKKDSTDQQPGILRLALPLPHSPAHDKDYRVRATITPTQFYIVNVSGVIHLRTATMKDERRTNGRPATLADDVDTKGTLSTVRDVIHIGQDRNTPGLSARKSRRYYSKARKRKRYPHPHQRKRQRRKHRRRYPKYSDDSNQHQRDVEYQMLRRRRKTAEVRRRFSSITPSLKREKKQKTRQFSSSPVTHLFENAKRKEPTYLPTPTSKFLSVLDDREDGKHIKHIEEQDRLRHNRTSQKDRPTIYHQVKDSSKGVKIKEKDRNQNVKAELIRKIMEGSSYSYSDDEAILTKNLIGALRYGNRI